MIDLDRLALVSRMSRALDNLAEPFLADADIRRACYKIARAGSDALPHGQYEAADTDAVTAQTLRRMLMNKTVVLAA